MLPSRDSGRKGTTFPRTDQIFLGLFCIGASFFGKKGLPDLLIIRSVGKGILGLRAEKRKKT